MQRPRKEQGEQTRKTIIDVTTRLFATRGYAGTSLDLIAKEAQTSKSSIFWHFQNKEDLLFTVVDRAMSEWEVKAGSEILAQPDPPRQLSKLIELYRELAQERPDTLRLLLGLLLETADANEEVKKRFQRMYQGYRTSIQIVIEEGANGGFFERTIPSSHLSAMTLALFDGLFIQAFLDEGAIAEDIFDSVKKTVFTLLMPGKPIPAPDPSPVKVETPATSAQAPAAPAQAPAAPAQPAQAPAAPAQAPAAAPTAPPPATA